MTHPVDAIADELEEDIALGLLHPRERLVEDALMERFGARRHVVRSALAALEVRGAVERRPYAGALVRSFGADEVRDLYAVRELLEVACARAVALPVPAESLGPLEAAQRQHAEAAASGDRRAALRANLLFHELLFGLAANRVLVEAVRRHARMAAPIRSATVVDDELLTRAVREHREMVRALREERREDLARLCAQHLAPSRDAYLARLGG